MSMRSGGGRCRKSSGTSAIAITWNVRAIAFAPMKTESTKKIQNMERLSAITQRALGLRCCSLIFWITDEDVLEGVMSERRILYVPSVPGTSSWLCE